MLFNTQLDRVIDDIHEARADVERTTLARNRGGSTRQVNVANARLASAYDRYREVTGGRIHDDR